MTVAVADRVRGASGGNMRNYPNPGMPERPGLIGTAHGGTVFLDEIGELPIEIQAHLLRVLDAGGEYHRLGEATPRRADVRIIAATNRSVDALKGDLAARFAIKLEVPDLDSRKEDLPLLVRHLLRQAHRDSTSLVDRFFDNAGEPRVGSRLIEALLRRNYKNNVRELRELLWRSIAESRGDRVDAVGWSEATGGAVASRAEARQPSKEEVREALARHHGSASRASRDLGLSSRYALYRLMKKYGITEDDDSTS